MSFQQKIDPIHSKFTICINKDVLEIVIWACFQANVHAILQSMCIKSDSFYSYYLSCTKYFWKYSKFAMPVSAMIFVLYHFSTVIQADHFVVCDKIIPITRFMGPTWGPSGADRTQVDPMLAPWILLSRCSLVKKIRNLFTKCDHVHSICYLITSVCLYYFTR